MVNPRDIAVNAEEEEEETGSHRVGLCMWLVTTLYNSRVIVWNWEPQGWFVYVTGDHLI